MAKKKEKKKGIKPQSGLGISRNGKWFTFSWKLGDKKYDDQALRYRTYNSSKKPRKWHYVSLKKSTTSKSVKIDYDSDVTSMTKLEFQLKAKKNKKWSKYESAKYTKDIPAPPVPSGTVELNSEFAATYSLGVTTSDTSMDIFKGLVWQSVLAKDYNSNKGQNAPWSKVTNTDKGSIKSTPASIYREETGWSAPEYSYTRWFRAYSYGPGGNSGWGYVCHVFSRSKMTTNVSASLQKKSSGGYTVSVNWTTNSNYAKPVDKTVVQYTIVEPVATVTEVDGTKVTTLSCPTSSSWTSINALGDKSGNRGISFPVSQDIGANKAIFVRVNTTHDADTSTVEGEAVLVKGSFTTLSPPTGLQITESGTNKYTVSATHATNIAGSFIEVLYRTKNNQDANQVVGIIPAEGKSVTVVLPPLEDGDAIDLGVRSCVGNYSPIDQSATDVTYYMVAPLARSEIEWEGGSVPLPPSKVSVAQASSTSIQVTWEWSWSGATAAELSWADHEDAWESTNGPSTYTVNTVHASRWIISGLAVGTWYVRIRLIRSVGDATTYGTYSAIYPVKLSASPDTPHLMVSDGVVPKDGSVTCYWAYVSGDGTGQLQADIAEAFIDDEGDITYGNPLASTNSSQHLTLRISELDGWDAGTTHYLVARVTSISGETSVGWSAPAAVRIADNVQASFVKTSLEEIQTTLDTDTGESITVTELALTELPLVVQATGAGAGGVTRYIIERDGPYHVDRPDDSDFDGFDSETIAIKVMPTAEEQNSGADMPTAEDECRIDNIDLVGSLDDGARYRLFAEVMDSYGQTAMTTPIQFIVNWDHKAVEPEATIEIDKSSNVAFITPLLPETGYEEGDVCDIYRLSADPPELIVRDAVFGTKYVDPYPTLGQFGGYRIAYKTRYGDYIDVDNTPAWTDYDADDPDHPEYLLDLFGIVIDFDGDQLILPYDVAVDNSWSKDFIETKYLGGTVKGDWNPGVSKSASLSTNIAVQYNPENIEMVRALAVYPGACHVRTPDGSSYTANVDVKENREERKINMLAKISLDITKVSSEGEDGMTYAEWISGEE